MRDSDTDYTSTRARQPYTPIGWIKLVVLVVVVLLTIMGVVWMAGYYVTKDQQSVENQGMPGDMPGTPLVPPVESTPAPIDPH